MQLGVRQARYIGRTKTLCQLLLAATVANLTLVASRVGLMRERNHIRAHSSNQVGDLLTTILRAICRPFVVGVLPWMTAEGQVFGHTSRACLTNTCKLMNTVRTTFPYRTWCPPIVLPPASRLEPVDGVWASDHFGVVAELSAKTSSGRLLP